MFTVAICDDEQTFGEQIEKIIWQISEEFEERINVVIFTSGEELLKYMQQNSVELLFLDIELGKMTGIQVSCKIRKEENNEQIHIVFITGKDGYEKELFDFQPLNFIGKPLNEEKVKECIRMSYRKSTKGVRKFHYISHYQDYFVPMNQIVSFETEGKNIVMNLLKSREWFRSTMNLIEKQVDGNSFLRISQSVIINMEHIKSYNGEVVVMKNGQEYYVSRSKIKNVKQKYMEYILQK